MNKAPDNMPTEAIERFLKETKAGALDWQQTLAYHERAVQAAREMIVYHTEKEVEYEEWLEKRLEEESEANPA